MVSTPSFWSEPEWVSQDEIRKAFNEGDFLDKVAKGDLVANVLKSRHTKPASGQPSGTLSQMLTYQTKKGNLVALVHQYLRPDGSIGGSGLPDPKRLIWDNRLIAVRS